MKMLFLILLILFFHTSYSQKIEGTRFDKFDSTYTIFTKDEALVGKIFGKDFLYVKIHFNWLKKSKFMGNPDAKYFSIIVGFKTDIVTSTDNKSEIKVEFADGTLGTYNRPTANYQIVTEMGFISFKVPLDDKLFTTDIKAIRVSTSKTKLDYEIPSKKAAYIKNALALIKTESEKPS